MATVPHVDGPPRAGLVKRIDSVLDRWIHGWNPYHPSKLGDRGLEPVAIEESKIRKSVSRYIIIAALIFFGWSLTAPIDSGSAAQGSLVVAGYRKAVQHPNGGVVAAVLVEEGSKVKQGQVLLRINPLEAEATSSELEQNYINLLATESRAVAQVFNRPIVWDPALARLDPARVTAAKLIQTALYNKRRTQFIEQVRGLQAQGAGMRGTISAYELQLRSLAEELTNVRPLAEQGFVPKTQLAEKVRQVSEAEAALNSARAEMGKISASIAEIESKFTGDAATELADVQSKREATAPKLQAARFNDSLTAIRAPVSGTVVNLKVFTDGGVIAGKEMLMEIVPDNGRMIVEAKVMPGAIDKVSVGQKADVRFTSLNAVTTPVLEGVVKSVGIDKLKAKPGEELREGEDYYLAQVEIQPTELKRLGDRQLVAGMPVDVMIKRGERTFMSYLLKPITDRLAKAFKDG